MDIKYMKLAYKEAQKAFEKNEVPVGCVIVKDNIVIAKAYNKREYSQNSLYHAEMIAINKACKKLNSWRLDGCDIYITLEPCPMCSGAIIQSKIDNIYYGAKELKWGFAGSRYNIFDMKFNYSPNVVGGLMEIECSNLLKEFFKNQRKKN